MTTGSTWRKLEWGAAALLVCEALWAHAMRVVHGGGLWRDEAAAARLATLPSLRAVFRLFPHEAFPMAVPLTIRWYSRIAGGGDQALRCLGLAVGISIVVALFFAAHASGRTQPLLSLALIAGNAAFVVFGDSLRGYGLGSLFILLSYAALARLLLNPGAWTATDALCAALGAVHTLIGNSPLVAALCAAAALAALRRGERRVALVVLNIGLAAGLSLLPYLAPLNAARSWNQIVVYRPGVAQVLKVLRATLGAAAPVWLGLAAVAVAVAFRRRPVRDADAGDRVPAATAAAGVAGGAVADSNVAEGVAELRRFSGLAIVLGIAAQALFASALGYTPRAWYFLPLLSLIAAAVEPLIASLCVSPWTRAARIALALGLVAGVVPMTLPRLRMRMTNADLVARQLQGMASGGDLVVVYPWQYGISFDRYYRGPAAWLTLPDLADHRMHRYDLLKPKLASPHPIDDVLASVRQILGSGHRVWVVGDFRPPPPGRAPVILPPAPATTFGWNDIPYSLSWELQLGALLRDHAASLRPVPPVPSAEPINGLERMRLAVAAGWIP